MERRRRRITGVIVALGALAGAELAGGAAAADGTGEPRRLRGRLFDSDVVIEVRDLPAEAARAALAEAYYLVEASERAIARTETASAADARQERSLELAPEIVSLLERAQGYCTWSGGAVGPLGGALAEHWRAVAGNPAPPPPSPAVIASGACDRLALDATSGTATLAAGSRLSLAPFGIGWAVDRAVARLRELGAANGLVRIGRIERAFGPGPPAVDAWGAPVAAGWPAALPPFDGETGEGEHLRLADRALAVLWRAEWPPERPLHVDQRDGRAPEGLWATVALSPHALDAQAVAVAAMVLGAREGRFRLANLQPEPSVLWVMGSGRGRSLRSGLNWSEVRSR